MRSSIPRVAITGAYGYLGSAIRNRLEADGWATVPLVRSPRKGDANAEHFDLADGVTPESLGTVQALVHCAYDLSLVRWEDIYSVNIDGSKSLFCAARTAGVERIIHLSSMAAFEGTSQLYGQAKLAIEVIAAELGGSSVRPGVVYAQRPKGMAGSLQKLTRLPLTPITPSRCYVVAEEDLLAIISALLQVNTLPAQPVRATTPSPVPLRDLVEWLARSTGRSVRVVSVPWKPLYWSLRIGEALGLRMPFRADSLVGLMNPAPEAVGTDIVAELGIRLRELEPAGRIG